MPMVLLAAVALKKIHRINGYCVAAYRFAVVFHEYPISNQNLMTSPSALNWNRQFDANLALLSLNLAG